MNIAIYGYGNLGKGVELAIGQTEDMSLFGIFTRRNPESVKTLTGAPVFLADEIFKFEDKIDVVIICGGSATDLPIMTPMLASRFNVVDSFDTHANIPSHFEKVNKASVEGGKVSVISSGWDPGMFSLLRVYSEAVLPEGKSYTFWGRGVSQGHSDAIRRIDGVVDARQYTVPVSSAIERVLSGEEPELSVREKHTRECFVVAEEGADKARIEKEIKEMPNYFAEYNTSVTFITKEEMKKNHSSLPHGGVVIRTGKTGIENEHSHAIEYKLNLASNPEFTASVLVSSARAAKRISDRGETGCKTILEIAPADLSPKSIEDLRKNIL